MGQGRDWLLALMPLWHLQILWPSHWCQLQECNIAFSWASKKSLDSQGGKRKETEGSKQQKGCVVIRDPGGSQPLYLQALVVLKGNLGISSAKRLARWELLSSLGVGEVPSNPAIPLHVCMQCLCLSLSMQGILDWVTNECMHKLQNIVNMSFVHFNCLAFSRGAPLLFCTEHFWMDSWWLFQSVLGECVKNEGAGYGIPNK